MALLLPVLSTHRGNPFLGTKLDFAPSSTINRIARDMKSSVYIREIGKQSFSIRCSAHKLVRDRSLDRHVVKQNRIRFVQKLRTLLLSKPKHYMSLHILAKCRSYLALSKPRSIVAMIQRYPTIFELFYIPYPPTPLNAAKTNSQLCVRLTPAAEALSIQEARLKSSASITLANKLQKLLMLSPYRRIVLSKLVHLGPDLGLPPNFRSRLCNEHPGKFRTVDTSYGHALELISWDPELAHPLPRIRTESQELIVDRPLKFKLVKLRKGTTVKRCHHDFLIKFGELPDICPYTTSIEEFPKNSLEAEKRACSVVREILGMTVEKRTLIDHLTHFRKDFGLPNKLRSMLVRHPELFYVSLKGERDSVFLVEAYDDNGELIEKDEALVVKERLLSLVRDGKRIRQEKKLASENDDIMFNDHPVVAIEDAIEPYDVDDEDDDFEDLFSSDGSDLEIYGEDSDYEYGQPANINRKQKFWSSAGANTVDLNAGESSEPW
uniref:PORR domain-containing protein n=1 Tax=Opuntia streptacantha TaxID=393608 RepID=A0A7C9AKG8_OPUST